MHIPAMDFSFSDSPVWFGRETARRLSSALAGILISPGEELFQLLLGTSGRPADQNATTVQIIGNGTKCPSVFPELENTLNNPLFGFNRHQALISNRPLVHPAVGYAFLASARALLDALSCHLGMGDNHIFLEARPSGRRMGSPSVPQCFLLYFPNGSTTRRKVAILRRHLVEGMPISDRCDGSGLQPTVFYRWQKEFLENGAAAFQQRGRTKPSARTGTNRVSGKEGPAEG
jgi:hypothetical protein